METKSIRVLHIDSEKSWRGGQQQAYYLHEGLTREKIFSLLVSKSNSEIHKKCLTNNLPSIEIAMANEVDIFSAYKISKICKKNKITILHTHTAHALAIGLLTKLFYKKVKLIGVRRVDFHLKKNVLSKLKYNNRLIDKMVCISNGIKKVLIEDKLDIKKLTTIHSGVNITKFDDIKLDEKFKSNLGINKNNLIVGTVAAFVGHKDYPNLLNAAKKVIDKFKNVIFILLGDGSLKCDMELLADKLQISNSIIFAGFQKDIGEYLKVFDIFVLSSKLEGLGTSILDAQSVGLPVVATNTGGIPEAVKDKVNGIVVERKKSTSLANAILELLNDEKKREKYGSAGLISVKEFSIDNTIRKNIELYKKLLV